MADSGRARGGRSALTIVEAPGADADEEREIVRGLVQRPRRLPCRLFYDERGSRLFERICELPEYYLTRTEHALLAERAAEIAALAGPAHLVELGSGAATKTRLLIDAYRAHGGPLAYSAIDVSDSSLGVAAAALTARYPSLAVQGVVATYEAGLAALATRVPVEGPRLVLFLGSTIGNLDPGETRQFLARVRATLAPGDGFLVGTDLEKDPAVIEAAYNDAEGVTAAFNLNILRHVNRRFRADFALDSFAHVAFYARDKRQIEMHLESRAAQRVALAALGLEIELEAGERIETEISRKFELASFAAELAAHGFEVARQWTDAKAWFGLTLARAV
ncbi:MAG TPA: L-histidine N(alpha)-methyltransferase [Alphaproteobacteria bacterium]|nr:L-histidine N(alpha)-methyltransferase [Alphaproteobacteria bacterium]